jgi:predicted lipoprotein with Yx(FWY)xxD motif
MKAETGITAVLRAAALLILAGAPLAAPAHDLLTGKDDMTLYTYDRDVAGGGSSACAWQCIRVWPPARADGMRGPGFGAITREGGERQLTYEGRPLYYFIGDRRPGDANGDGLDQMWHVVLLPRLSARR